MAGRLPLLHAAASGPIAAWAAPGAADATIAIKAALLAVSFSMTMKLLEAIARRGCGAPVVSSPHACQIG
jgi:hypothetical protein